MSSFSEYVNGQVNKSTDELVKRTVIKPVQAEDTIEDTVAKCNPETWTAREINNVKYLIYNKKFINISELKQKIADVYREKGYSDYGFAKLTERDLVRYTKVKNILMDSFLSEVSDELDTDYLAGKFFDKELKDFDWKPEEY
jgi:hypothetical protein